MRPRVTSAGAFLFLSTGSLSKPQLRTTVFMPLSEGATCKWGFLMLGVSTRGKTMLKCILRKESQKDVS